MKNYNYQNEEDDDEQSKQDSNDNRENSNISDIGLYRNYQDEEDENQIQVYKNKSEPQLNYYNNNQIKDSIDDNKYDDEYNQDNQGQEYKQYQEDKYNNRKKNVKEIEQEIYMQNYLDQSDEDIERINDNQIYTINNEQITNQTPQQINRQQRIKQVGEVASAPHSLSINQESLQSQKNKQQRVKQQLAQNDCQFCEWQIRRIKFLRENLHMKYFETFNFYFAKPINEILANYNLPHVIMLKDFQYFQDENEYLKRYYRVDEVPPRLAVLTNFFTNSYKQTKPNLIITNQHRVISKRNSKQARLFMRQVAKNVNNGIGYNANNLYNKDDSSESEAYSSEKNESNQQENNSKGNKKKTNLPSRVLNSHLSQTIPLSQNQSQTGEQSMSSNEHEYDNYRNFIMQMSFETSTHDIYYPSFSSQNKDSEIAQNISQRAVNMNNNQQLNFKKQEKNINQYEQEEDYKSNTDQKEGLNEIYNLGLNINNENLPYQKVSYFNKRELNMIEQNLGLKQNKKENFFIDPDQEKEKIDPHLLNLIVGVENDNQNQNGNQILKKQQNFEKKDYNVNQIIELMQSQLQNNYLNILDIQTSQSENFDPGFNSLIEINKNNNINYDPSKRISTLISQSSSTQMSHFNTFNANNYIIGSNSNKIQNSTITAPKQNPLKFEKQQLAELQLGSPVLRNVNQLNNEGKSSRTSLQPIFSHREEINLMSPLLQYEDNGYSHNQYPLKTKDLQSNNNEYQGMQSHTQQQNNLNNQELDVMKLEQKSLNGSQKSIQQVQKYILSQIKKQHDCINMVRNQQGMSSISSLQHPIYTSLSPEQKIRKIELKQHFKQNNQDTFKLIIYINYQINNNKKDQKDSNLNLQKTLKKNKGSNLHSKDLKEVKGKQKYLGQSGNCIVNSNRKQLNERNFTEVNLGSVFERLMLSNRLGSQETKQKNVTNESNNLEIYIQKIANNSLSRNNSTKKKKNKQGTTQRSNLATSSDISPLGYTPRDFTLKNQSQKFEPSTSLKYLHTEQSPDQIRKKNNTNNIQLGYKKNSLSHNQLNSNSSIKNIVNNQNKPREQTSFDNGIASGRVSVSPSQLYPYQNQIANSKAIKDTVNAQITTTIDHSSPNNNSLVTSLFKDTQNNKSNKNLNKRIHSISNIRNKIISAGEQKSSLNSPSRICTDRESKNPRLKQSKSPPQSNQGGLSNISRKKTNQKRTSNSKIYSPNSHSYQKQTPSSVLQNNYYQRSEETGNTQQLNQNNSLNIQNSNWNQQESQVNYTNQQNNEISNSNLQMLLIQQLQQGQMTSNINTNNLSSNATTAQNQNSGLFSQQNPKLNGIQSLTQSQNNTNQSSQRTQNKIISQKILTNALTNTINKFYKNIIKNLEQENQKYNSPNSNLQATQKLTSSSQQNRHQTTISPSQNQQLQQHLQETISPDNQYSPRLISSQAQNYQQINPKQNANQTQSRLQGRVKTSSSEEMTQKIIKSLCIQKTKNKDSIGSQNQMSYNLDTLNSARTSSITKVQEYRGCSENGVYGNGGQVNVQTINNLKKKQMQIRQKGNNQKITNQATANINGQINNQSINSSGDNINLQNTNYISDVTNNGTININSNNFLSNMNYSSKTNNNPKSFNQSNYSSKVNAFIHQSNQVTNLNQNLSSSQMLNIPSNNTAQNFQQSNNSQTHILQQQQKQLQQQQQLQYQQQQSQISQQNSQNQYQQWQNMIQQQALQNQPVLNNQNIIDQQVHHTRIESVKSNNTPRQSKSRIKPPSAQKGNSSQIGISKASDYRAVKTEAPLLTEESQQQYNAFFKNILSHDTSSSGIILSQQQLIKSDLNPIHQYLQNSKMVQQQNMNGNNTSQNNNSQYTLIPNNPQNKSSSTSSVIKNTLSPGRSVEVKKKVKNQKEDNFIQINQQSLQSPSKGLQLMTSLAQSKKRQEEVLLGNGFYTQRNTGKQRKKSNDLHGSNQKYIQSSRGSYQGHYADLSAWKHASSVNQNQNINYLQQQQQNIPIINHENYKKDVKQQQQQYNTLLNTSPIRQQQSQPNIYQQQQSKQQAIYQPLSNINNQMSQTPLTQQQTDGLINHKIKQLSQKFLMQ